MKEGDNLANISILIDEIGNVKFRNNSSYWYEIFR